MVCHISSVLYDRDYSRHCKHYSGHCLRLNINSGKLGPYLYLMKVQEKKSSGSQAACLPDRVTHKGAFLFFHMFNFLQFETDEATIVCTVDLELTHIWQAVHNKVVWRSNKNRSPISNHAWNCRWKVKQCNTLFDNLIFIVINVLSRDESVYCSYSYFPQTFSRIIILEKQETAASMSKLVRLATTQPFY